MDVISVMVMDKVIVRMRMGGKGGVVIWHDVASV